MVKLYVGVFAVFTALRVAISMPSDLTSTAITRDIKVELPGSERINKRSVEASSLLDSSEDKFPVVPIDETDFDMAESNIVFHPLFATRRLLVDKKRLSKRSIQNSKENNEDEMELAENGMVFRPLFRSRNNFGLRPVSRPVRSIIQDNNFKSEIANGDDLDVNENGLVFRPLFRTRQRDTRSVEENANGVDDLEAHENGLVFRPLFRTRQRDTRSVEEELVNVADLEAHENGLVFRPVFRTRQRDSRSI